MFLPELFQSDYIREVKVSRWYCYFVVNHTAEYCIRQDQLNECSWLRRWSDQQSYSTLGLVSTGMGDRIGVQLPLREIYLSSTNHPGQLSLTIPSWVGTLSTGQRAVMLCEWGVKADMVLFAGNTVWSISERVRGVCVDALYKLTFTLL